ncbi:MAG: acyltransferase domain-containing protein, partial [Cyanobacteria bacterium P01_D01_bin.2]
RSPVICPEPPQMQDRPWQVLTLSAKTPPALRDLAQRYHAHLSRADETSLADICFTANTGRAHLSQRLAIATPSITQLQSQLTDYLDRQPCAGVFAGEAPIETPPRIAFLFTGQGSQYVGMGRQLYETQPTFRQAIERCAAILEAYLERPLLEVLYSQGNGDGLLNQTAYTQPALFALEYALYQLWQSWGIHPDVVMGHSVGEYVAACVAGVFSLEDGLKLIALRGKLMQQLPEGGMMVALMAPAAQVEAVLSAHPQVSVAAINGPESTVISGPEAAVEAVVNQLVGIKRKALQVSHGFHSPLMQPMVDEFEAVARQVSYGPPQIKLVSNVTGEVIDQAVAGPEYWCEHVLAPVNFAGGMAALGGLGCEIFLECGAKPILLGLGQGCLPAGGVWLPSLRPGWDEWQQMLSSLGELYRQGVSVDWRGFEGDYPQRQKVALPTYPFQRQSFWLPPTPMPSQRTVSAPVHPLLGQKLVSALKEIQFESHLSPNDPAFLAQHQVFGAVVLPATAYLEMALAAGAHAFKAETLMLEEVVIQEALIFGDASPTQTTQTILTPETADRAGVEIFSLEAGGDTCNAGTEPVWRSHARCKIQVAANSTQLLPGPDLAQRQAECLEAVDILSYYQALSGQGLDYGPDFQAIENLWRAEGQALAQIQLSQELRASQFQIHPVLLDACFQTVGGALNTSAQETTYLPTLIKQFHLKRQPGRHLWCHAQVCRQSKTKGVRVDLKLWDEQGSAIAEIHQLHLVPVTRERLLGQSQT